MTKQQNDLFSLLRNKQIISILDGDSSFGEISIHDTQRSIRIALPYMKGPEICELSTQFGLPTVYPWGGEILSRSVYFDNLLEHCIRSHRMSDLLIHLFSIERFSTILSGLSPENISTCYEDIVASVLNRINGILFFGKHKLVSISGRYYIQPINTVVTIEAPTLNFVTQDYIKDITARALKDVSEENYDSAITKCRTLLEETFCYVLEKHAVSPSDSGDIRKLYNQVKTQLNMHQDRDTDHRINGLLSGLEKILTAIAEMRNESSDSHGVGAKRIRISDHHARLFVNAAMTMAEFILSVNEKQQE